MQSPSILTLEPSLQVPQQKPLANPPKACLGHWKQRGPLTNILQGGVCQYISRVRERISHMYNETDSELLTRPENAIVRNSLSFLILKYPGIAVVTILHVPCSGHEALAHI